MPRHRRSAYSATRSRRTSRQVNDSMVGTHVERRGYAESRRVVQKRAIVRRARLKRFVVGAVAVLVVIGIALGAGFMAFRGVVGGAISLKDSDAKDALVAVRSNEPTYIMVSVELGATAEPLETVGPDALFLVRLDSENKTMALVTVPTELQITKDNQSDSIASIAANKGDAAMIEAFSAFAKVDISHFVKIATADDVAGMVDALGGVETDVRQEIDDPHAGYQCIPSGTRNLSGAEALTFLRATNIALSVDDRLLNQLDFAADVLADVFSLEGNLATRLDSISGFVQTDLSLDEIEALGSWLGGISAKDISTAILPGYYTAVTNVTGNDVGRYVSTSNDVAGLVEKLENNEKMSADDIGSVDLVKPSSFTVSIQNGTSVEGAAKSVADSLKAAGFKVGSVGNAENPVYDETIVVYRGSDEKGLSRAKTVIDQIGVGRAVDGDAYYNLDSDVLLIIGADNKPVS